MALHRGGMLTHWKGACRKRLTCEKSTNVQWAGFVSRSTFFDNIRGKKRSRTPSAGAEPRVVELVVVHGWFIGSLNLESLWLLTERRSLVKRAREKLRNSAYVRPPPPTPISDSSIQSRDTDGLDTKYLSGLCPIPDSHSRWGQATTLGRPIRNGIC